MPVIVFVLHPDKGNPLFLHPGSPWAASVQKLTRLHINSFSNTPGKSFERVRWKIKCPKSVELPFKLR